LTVWSGGRSKPGRRRCPSDGSRSAPRRRRETGRAGFRAWLPECVRLYLTSLAVTEPGKANPCVRASGAVDDLLQGCSLLVVPSVVSTRGAGSQANMSAIRPTARQCDAARPFCRRTPCRMAEFAWPARRQIPCKRSRASMASRASRRGLGDRRWLRYAGIAVLAVVALAVVRSFLIDEPLRRVVVRQMNRQLKGYSADIRKVSFHPIGISRRSTSLDGSTILRPARSRRS
jgi:hypothetical protein